MENANIIIEVAKKEDLKDILELYGQPDIDNGNVLSLQKATEIFNKLQKYPDYHIYIAKMNYRIVGTFSLIIMDNMVHLGKSSGLVESVVVHADYRSKGIGKMMMEFAINKCKEANCYKMCLSSSLIRERAHSFYEKLGFKIHGYSFLIEL